MKLVVIYGPPAAGKLTVAKELEKITKYKLFHNHLVMDLVNSIFDPSSEQARYYSFKFRLELLEAAAKEKTKGIITTFVYAHPSGDEFIKQAIKRVIKQKGKVLFVQLVCDKRELEKRIRNPSRSKFTKLKTIKGLNHSLKKYNLLSQILYVKNLQINNTKLSPKKVAIKIKKHYKL